MMMLPVPLFADIGDVIGLVVTILIIGFSILSKLLTAKEAAPPQPPPQQRRAGPAGPAGRPRPAPAAGAPRVPRIEQEIEDFLREVQGNRPPRPAPPPPSAEAVPTAKKIIEAVPAEASIPPEDVVPGREFGRELVDHVAEHIGKDSISTRDAHLGDVVEQADERIEDRLRDVFDHDLGQLAHLEKTNMEIREGTDADAWKNKVTSNAAADEIRALLKAPQSIRNAFILAEILKRPEL